MRPDPLGIAAVLAVVLLVVVAGTAGTTAASFADEEVINATFSTEDPGVTATEASWLDVVVQNGQQTDDWADGISYGPPDYRTSVLVITDGDGELRLEIESNATEPLRFEVDAGLVRDALGVTDLDGVTATLDGQPLAFTTQTVGNSERVVFTVDEFSTRYVAFTAPEEVAETQTGPPGQDNRPSHAGGPDTDGGSPTADA